MSRIKSYCWSLHILFSRDSKNRLISQKYEMYKELSAWNTRKRLTLPFVLTAPFITAQRGHLTDKCLRYTTGWATMYPYTLSIICHVWRSDGEQPGCLHSPVPLHCRAQTQPWLSPVSSELHLPTLPWHEAVRMLCCPHLPPKTSETPSSIAHSWWH